MERAGDRQRLLGEKAEGTDWVSRKSSDHRHNSATMPAARIGAPLPCARAIGSSSIGSSSIGSSMITIAVLSRNPLATPSQVSKKP